MLMEILDILHVDFKWRTKSVFQQSDLGSIFELKKGWREVCTQYKGARMSNVPVTLGKS